MSSSRGRSWSAATTASTGRRRLAGTARRRDRRRHADPGAWCRCPRCQWPPCRPRSDRRAAAALRRARTRRTRRDGPAQPSRRAGPPRARRGKNPGYPFFIPGIAGRRAPQPPLDFARDPCGTAARRRPAPPRRAEQANRLRRSLSPGEHLRLLARLLLPQYHQQHDEPDPTHRPADPRERHALRKIRDGLPRARYASDRSARRLPRRVPDQWRNTASRHTIRRPGATPGTSGSDIDTGRPSRPARSSISTARTSVIRRDRSRHSTTRPPTSSSTSSSTRRGGTIPSSGSPRSGRTSPTS